MPKKIDPNYQPSDRVYELLAPLLGTVERAREFVGHELPEFVFYWEGREGKGAAKENWHSTCLNWMKRSYENKKESMARNREWGKQKDNVFQDVLGGMIADGMSTQHPPCKHFAPRIVNAPIPGEGETMSESDALEALARISR